MNNHEPLQDIKKRRDGALQSIVNSIPFSKFLGTRVERLGNELTIILPYDQKLIGNPELPALHGGGVAGFLEFSAIISLAWHSIWDDLETGNIAYSENLASRIFVTNRGHV